MLGGTGAMTIADGPRNVPRRRSWKRFLHALVFLSLIGLQVHQAFERGPRDGVDASWYIDYALSILHERRLPPGTVDVVPLYPLWLTMWMRIDPDYRGYLQCLRFNLPYWSGGKVIRDGDTSLCRHLDNAGFYVQALLGAIGTGLVWLAGWLASGRPMVAHLSAFFAVYAGQWLVLGGNAHVPESLVIPLFAGVNVCLAWLVLSGVRRRRGGARLRTTAVAITCGLLLGALALVRPPYEFLLAALPAAAAVWMLRDRPRRRAIVVVTAWILVSALLVVTPWLVRNYTEKGFVGFTEGYGPWILMERLAYNNMAWHQWLAAFPRWSGRGGHRLALEWFGKDTVRWLKYGEPEVRERRISGGGHLLTNVATGDQLGVVLERVWAELPRHLVVSVPLAWRGMDQTRNIPYGSVCWLLVVLGFVLGSRRNRSVLAALAFCPFFVLAINALVSVSVPRYSIGLLMPLSVGVALPVAWMLEGAWSRMRRPWEREPAPRDGPRNGPPP